MAAEETRVLVVGAGPSGLMLAKVLAGEGVPVVLIDGKSGPTDESRAVGVHIRTLELWDKWGLAESAIAAGEKMDRVVVANAGRDLATVRLGAGVPTPYDFVLNLPQGRTERLLVDVLDGGVRWNTRLVGYELDGSRVRATVRTPTRLDKFDADYLVGADGASSVVRRLTGIPFPGGTYAPAAFLADVRLEPAPRHSTLNLAKGGFVGISPIGDGWHRLFGALSPGYARTFSLRDRVPVDDLQRWFDEYFSLPNRIEDVGWTSIYRIHHRLAERFRRGPVFLIGDAAHLHAPAGGQGMNLGVGDAVNLGWKLALVARGLASTELLDSYEAERRPVARQILRGADRGFELEATENPVIEWFRRHVLPLGLRAAARIPRFGRVLRNLFSQTWIGYRDSPAVQPGGEGAVQPGDRAPFAETGDGRTTFDLTRRPVHHLLCFGKDAGVPPAYDLPMETHQLPIDGPAADRYGITRPGSVLVRPDGHIAAIASTDGQDSVAAYLDRWYARTAGAHSGPSRRR